MEAINKECKQCKQHGKTAEMFEKLDEFIKEHKDEPGAVMTVLHRAQEIFGYLPLQVQKRIAEGLDIPLSEVYGVVTF